MHLHTQPTSAKKGEVLYREKLSKQHFGNKIKYRQEYDQKEMFTALQEKIIRIKKDFSDLQKKQINFSPFLEIGSGHGQASLILTNKYKAHGFATDISKEPLSSINKIKTKLKFKKKPKIIFCDAENLPFSNNSFEFIFCYQTLHHFPHPKTVTKEVSRVLRPGGWFFFAEEPIKQTFNIRLWYRPTKLRWWEKILKLTLILPFISKIGKTEIDHGILENAFSIPEWKESLKYFEVVETKIFPFPFGITGSMKKNQNKWTNSSFLNRLCLFFLGGGIKGLAQKKITNDKIKISKNNIPDYTCVNCKVKNDKPKLIYRNNKYLCPNCKNIYTIKSDNLILLPKKLHQELYPE